MLFDALLMFLIGFCLSFVVLNFMMFDAVLFLMVLNLFLIFAGRRDRPQQPAAARSIARSLWDAAFGTQGTEKHKCSKQIQNIESIEIVKKNSKRV